MNINIKELRELINEVKQQRLKEYHGSESEREATRNFRPQNVHGSPPPEEEYRDVEDYRDATDGQLTDEEKARSFEDMFQNMKNILDAWKERDPNTVAGKYFHDLLHLAKTYDPSYFPTSEIELFDEIPQEPE
jgi:hypothetical protein